MFKYYQEDFDRFIDENNFRVLTEENCMNCKNSQIGFDMRWRCNLTAYLIVDAGHICDRHLKCQE